MLGIVLSMMGTAVGWGLFVFSSVQDVDALLWAVTSAAGLGAGVGAVLAWIRLDRETWWSILIKLLTAFVVGIGGAWAGYEFGSQQEVECCAMPDISPITYTAFGATVAANVAVIVVSLIWDSVARRRYRRLMDGTV